MKYQYCQNCGTKVTEENKQIGVENGMPVKPKCPGCNVNLDHIVTIDSLSHYKHSRETPYEDILDKYFEGMFDETISRIQDKIDYDVKESIQLEEEITELEGTWSRYSSKISMMSANEELFDADIKYYERKIKGLEEMIESKKRGKFINITRSNYLKERLASLSISFNKQA